MVKGTLVETPRPGWFIVDSKMKLSRSLVMEWESKLRTAMTLDQQDEYAEAKKLYDEVNRESRKRIKEDADPHTRDWMVSFVNFVRAIRKGDHPALYPGKAPDSCLWRAHFFRHGEALLPMRPTPIPNDNWSDSGFISWDDDEETTKRCEPGLHIVNDGRRDTTDHTDWKERIHGYQKQCEIGNYDSFEKFQDDAIQYETDYSNISERHAGEFVGRKGNTVTQAKSRRLAEIARDLNRSTQDGEDKFICTLLDKTFPKGSEHSDGFYLLVKFPHTKPKLYSLAVSFIRDERGDAEYDEDEMTQSIHDLRFRIAKDKAYKAESTGDYDKDAQIGHDIGVHVWDVFSRARLFFFVFHPAVEQAA